MLSTMNPEDALPLKEKGNAFYKSGELLKAIEQYRLACAADPTAPLLLFNLSAAQFETGQYIASLHSTKTGIELCDPTADGELLAKLWLRRAKCELHQQNFRAAEEAAKQVSGIRASDAVRKDAKDLELAAGVLGYYNKTLSEEETLRVVFEMPKYRPRLCTNVSEYYNLGHDSAQSQFDPTTFPSTPGTHSFFFGGIGDARHLFATLITISQHESSNLHKTKFSQVSNYHFTINDIKPHTLARDFLILLLIHQLSISGNDLQTKIDTLSLLFYIYLGVLMPSRVHRHLQELLHTARITLATPSLLPPWLWVSRRDSTKIMSVLENWTESMFPVTHAQAQIAEAERMMPQGEKPKGCEREFTAYRRTGALFPPKEIRGFESELEGFLAGGPGVGGPGMVAWEGGLRAYVGREWKVNMTLVDREWCMEAGVWDVSFDPFSIAEMLYAKVNIPRPEEPTQLYDYFEPFFMHTAKAFSELGGNIKIEVNIDDCCSALEEIRFAHKFVPKDLQRPVEFPRVYDRVHLSNIPDYIGGHLSTALYVLPVLKDAPHAYFTSTCLVNPPLWQSVEDYISEYLCLPTLPKLQAATCLKLCPGQDELLHEFMPMCEYINWQHSTSKPLPYSQLLPRPVFTRWLLMVFFKFAVPPNSEHRSMARVFSPLNLSAWVRLLVRVVEIGYPPHWVSSLVEDILENRITTTSRPPEITPLRIPALEKEYAPKKISTSPFIPELEVLLTIWLRISPFAIVSPSHIIPPEKIYEYSFVVASPQFRDEFINCLTLMLYPEHILEELHKTGHGKQKTCVRDMLSSGGQYTPLKAAMRGVVIKIGTWWWDKKSKRVTFRMKEGRIESWEERDRWVAGLWRMDDWTMCSAPTSLKGNLEKRTLRWGRGVVEDFGGEEMEMDE